jgi:signal transduction histidine kinase
MNNLIDNAVKYTDKGTIEITIRVENKLDPDTILLRCSIKDTGRGVPPEKQQTIFEAFIQGEEYSTRRQDGAGLGLAICQKLVEFMEGSIWVESLLDHGSTFHFTAKFSV